MTNSKVKLFYSYSHSDEEHREKLEKVLSLSRDEGILDDWSDRNVGAGDLLMPTIEERLMSSDIVIMLVSLEFLASKSCKSEVETALALMQENKTAVIPVILSPCGWQTTAIGALNALPADGKPILSCANQAQAWEEIRVAVTKKIKEIQKNKAPALKGSFAEFLQKVEFVHDGREKVSLDKLYVPPRLESMSQGSLLESPTDCYSEVTKLSARKRVLIRGEARSGKTAMSKHIYTQARAEGLTPLYIDGNTTHQVKMENIVKHWFHEQYDGTYESYCALDLSAKMIIIDNIDADLLNKGLRDSIVKAASAAAQHVFCFVQDDNYVSSLHKDKTFVDFNSYRIGGYGRQMRRKCAVKWLALKNKETDYEEDHEVRHMENIYRYQMMPPYPYYVYSILQAREAFMPSNLQMTQSGHCHYAIIVAQLLKSGVMGDDIDDYYNFLSELAYFMYERNSVVLTEKELRGFIGQYGEKYCFTDGAQKVLRVLSGGHYSVLRKQEGGAENLYSFQYDYAYYFFLGAYIARHIKQSKQVVQNLRETLHQRQSALALLFTIHHIKDVEIVEDLALQGLFQYEEYAEAFLDKNETASMSSILAGIPDKIMDDTKDVREEKARDDAMQDEHDRQTQKREESAEQLAETDDDIKKFMMAVKTMEVLGQILRNHGGSLPKGTLSEIFKSAQSLGLRILKHLLNSLQGEEFFEYLLERARKMHGDKTSEEKIRREIKKGVDLLSLLLVRGVLLKIASEISSEKCLLLADRNVGETPARMLVNYIIHLFVDKGYRLDQEGNQKLIDEFIRLNEEFSENPYAQLLLKALTADHAHKHEILFQHKQKLKHLINKKD